MLRIAKLTDYATAVMSRLAHEPERCMSALQLAEDLGLPLPTVANLLKRLGRAELVRSARGAGGGYTLARAPRQISVAEVVTAIEGPLALTECALGVGNCALESGCAIRPNWLLISQAVRTALEAVRLSDMARPDMARPDMAKPMQVPIRDLRGVRP